MKPPQGPTNNSDGHWKIDADKLHGEGWSERHGIGATEQTQANPEAEAPDSFMAALGDISSGKRGLELADIEGVELSAKRSSGQVEHDHAVIALEDRDGLPVVRTRNPNGVERTMPYESVVARNYDESLIRQRADRSLDIPPNVRVAMLVEAEMQRLQRDEAAMNATTVPRAEVVPSPPVSVDDDPTATYNVADFEPALEQPALDDEPTLEGDILEEVQAAVAAARAAQEADMPAEAMAIENVIADQITALENGEGVAHVVDALLPPQDLETEQEQIAEEEVPATPEAEPEYMDQAELVENHFEDILRGNVDIEGANPEEVLQIKRMLDSMVDMYVDQKYKAEIEQVGAELIEQVKQRLIGGNSLTVVQNKLNEAQNRLHQFSRALRQFSSALQYGGLSGAVNERQLFNAAAAQVDADPYAGYDGLVGAIASGTAFAELLEDFRYLRETEQSATDDVNQLRGKIEAYDPSEERQEIERLFNENGRNLAALQDEIFSGTQDQEAIRIRLDTVAELATQVHTVTNIINFESTGGYYDHDIQDATLRMQQEAQMIVEGLRGSQIRVDPAKLDSVAYQSDQIVRIMGEVNDAANRAIRSVESLAA